MRQTRPHGIGASIFRFSFVKGPRDFHGSIVRARLICALGLSLAAARGGTLIEGMMRAELYTRLFCQPQTQPTERGSSIARSRVVRHVFPPSRFVNLPSRVKDTNTERRSERLTADHIRRDFYY